MLTLKPHQRKAVDELSNGKILVGGVGTGKTLVSLTYFREKEDDGNTDLYVITTARKRDSLDWEREAAQLTISTDREASTGRIQLVVDSWNNIEKYKDVKDAFFIFDEQRVVGSGAWVKAFLRIAKQNRWIMLSATPGDTWLDYIPVFVANGFYKNRTQFKREHVVYNTFVSKYPKVDHYISVGKLVRLRNSIQVKMPYERHTTRHIREIPVEYDRELLRKVVKERWHVYENRPLRDVAELFSVMRKIVNSDPSRLETLRTLLETHPRLIVFYNFDYELGMLRTLSQESSEKQDYTLSPSTPNKTSSMSSPAISAEVSSVEVESPVISSEDRVRNYTEDVSCELSCLSKTTQKSTELSSQRGSGNTSVESRTSNARSPSTEPSAHSAKSISGISSGGKSGSSHDLSRDGGISVGIRSQPSGDQKLPGCVSVAEWNGHRHDPVPTGDRWVYLVQYVAGAEAWNCTSTDTIVFYSLTYSYKNFEQAQGRIDRLDTAFLNLFYYVLISKAQIDVAIAKSLRSKKSFNEADFMS